MNERIKEFATLAKEHADTYDDAGTPIWFQFYNEKFAELIVSECYGEVQCQLYDYNPSSNEQYNVGHEAGLKLAVSKIKEHFGVKE